ncbi:hypothetical protein [Tenacibaculum jejuense]|uniref:GOLD domain-containing protein n=1 Tax=Tenacibaculum jejuense TaxID=584609 RepID=A0A238UAZ4_9FLAO|nr:hypothetical protein [Tenacibaculum jejuense]SNR16262.1 Protein of unknown function precursor [Tenacibaculum jejuense]
MKFNKFIIISILCNFAVSFLHASECYHYHTKHYYKLFSNANNLVFQHTVKDPNQVSFVSQEQVVLDKISTKDFRIISENTNSFIFSNESGYFLIPKEIYQIKNYGVKKIGTAQTVSKHIGNYFFCIDNEWNYVENISYSTAIKMKKVKLPEPLSLLTDFMARKLLLKGSNHVFSFDTDQLKFVRIPKLKAENTSFFKIENRYQEFGGFLYDTNTLYKAGVHDIINLTKEFSDQQKEFTLKKAVINQIDDAISIDTNDGFLWLYRENGLLEKQQGYSSIPLHFVRKKASYLNSYKEFVVYQNKVYKDFYELVRNWKPIDISAVKNVKIFRREGDTQYFDGIKRYFLDYKNKRIAVLNYPENSSKYIPGISGYHGFGNYDMYLGKEHLYRRTGKKVIKKEVVFFRDFKLFVAYNDRLVIENNDVKNLADIESMEFTGSIVDVLSPCDAEDEEGNYYDVEINVYYFFKDARGFYVYSSKDKKMKAIKEVKLTNTKDRFTNLQNLMRVAKESKN